MAKVIVRNFSWVFCAQVIVLIISIIRAIIIPKYLSVDGYGYWEIYWFYSCYTTIFCFGYNDGLYLNYGGYELDKLPRLKIRSVNILLSVTLSTISVISCAILLYFHFHNPEIYPFIFVLANIPVVCLTGISVYIYQITGKFKNYTFFSTLDKVIVICVIIGLILTKHLDYRYIILVDFIGRIIVLVIMICKLSVFWRGELTTFRESVIFLKGNISCGIKLMIANLMGMLLIGGGKIIVQTLGNIEDFAIYSFGFSITGLILTGITAVSLVLYPQIKRIDPDRYAILFCDVNAFSRIVGTLSVLLYFPCYIFLEWFYPKYETILPYLNSFFLIIYANIKISVLTNTFFNVTRRESILLKVNMGFVIGFIILASFLFGMTKSISVLALSTAIILILRAFSSEIYLSNKFDLHEIGQLSQEVTFLIIFYFCTSFLSFSISIPIVCLSYLVWLYLNRTLTGSLIKRILK